MDWTIYNGEERCTTTRDTGKVLSTYMMHPFRPPGMIDDIHILRFGHMPAKDSWVNHDLDYHVMVFVLNGEGQFRSSESPVANVKPGSCFCLYPGPSFHFGPSDGTTWEEYHLCLKGPGLERWKTWGLLPCDGRVYALSETTPLMPLIEEVRGYLDGTKPGDSDRAVTSSERLLVECAQLRQHRKRRGRNRSDVSQVIRYLHEHHTEDIDFEALAEEYHISYSLLRQGIRRLTGHPPQKYLVNIRLDAARKLLMQTDRGIADIGETVGFPDLYAFSRTFKRCCGMSPRDFRDTMTGWG